MTINYVHTLGDSTLDNLYWELGVDGNNVEEAKNRSVEGVLRSELGSSYQVISHAYDGFTTKSLLQGDRVGAVLPRQGNRKESYLAVKCPTGALDIQPLEELTKEIESKPNAIHYVVLSVGGNDFRVNLGRPWKLFSEIPNVQKRYAEIVQKIAALAATGVRPILMFQYRTDANNDPYKIYTILGAVTKLAAAVSAISLAVIATVTLLAATKVISLLAAIAFGVIAAAALLACLKIVPLRVTLGMFSGKHAGVLLISALMQKLYAPMLQLAKEKKLPILDLPNTFNPFEPLYTAGIEPNKAGANLISEGIAHIIKNHDFAQESHTYAKPNPDQPYKASENNNPSVWRVN